MSGLLECGDCGASYVGVTSRNTRGVETAYYTCSAKKRLKTCSAPNINASKIETMVSNYVQNMLDEHVDELVDALYEKLKATLGDYASEKKELAEVEKKIKNATNCIMFGIIYPELRDEIDNLQARKRELVKIIGNRNEQIIHHEKLKTLLLTKISTASTQKALIRLFVPKIKIHQDKQFTVYLGVAPFGSSEEGI